MERDRIPFVRSGVYSPPYPAIPLKDLSLEEIKKKYLSMCAKSNGSPAVCSKCQNPCEQGKRAVQLVANQVYNDPPVPLYGGKTLIERAKEENMIRRQQEESKKEQENKMPEDKPKRKRAHDDWWEESLASGDQIAWVMQKFSMTNNQARKKIYAYRYRNGLTDKTYLTKERKKSEPVIKCTTNADNDSSYVVVNAECSKEQQAITPSVFSTKHSENTESIEVKIDALMKLQESRKKEMEAKYAEYENAKKIYEDIKQKIDILCSAIDIINE